ncbi:hypothetical protein J2W27_003572 [Variovorax boronicumulans]|uniref:hypothetical protein n=1 Tax=Variovorax boronicumulans TaxID=436515 RepID=UPI0027808E32|nr:hypothetical protein [Variovorax boronicumulans]MDP9911448.1 hypothetical protein [Variovorax boronicumulans]
MWNELENALAWYSAAPERWVKSAKQDLSAAAEWIWVVLQGDFAEEQSTAQTVTATVISMIPFVDQICDVRDIVANCRKINEDTSDSWAWVALVLTLIGLFPVLGSVAKGCFKILFSYARKGVVKMGGKVAGADLWGATKPWVEAGIVKLNEFLARPPVRKAVAALKWDNVYKELAKLARKLADQVNVGALLKAMDEGIVTLKKLIGLIRKWGSDAMGAKAAELEQMAEKVRNVANKHLPMVIDPVQNWLRLLARRLELEADMNYRASTNALNPHAFKKPSLDAEIAELKKSKPAWVDVGHEAKYDPLDSAPVIPSGYPDIRRTSPSDALKGKFDTFNTIERKDIPPGTTLYRIIDPGSGDNSICWMEKAEFDKLTSKDDWRRRFAVWANWNSNGEFVTYTVPKDKPLKTWEGIVGSQKLSDSVGNTVSAGDRGKSFYLEGGGRQIVLDPRDLDKAHLGKRQPTNWGYSNFDETTSMVGVPTLTNNWFEPRK